MAAKVTILIAAVALSLTLGACGAPAAEVAAPAAPAAPSAPVVRHPDPRHCAGTASTYTGDDGCRVDGELVTVARATDATTLELTDGRRVRLLGVIAPAAGSCPANAATAAANAAIAGQPANLISESGTEADEYGSLWRYAQFGLYTGTDLGQQLALDGWVAAYPESPANAEYHRNLTIPAGVAQSTHVGQYGPPCGTPMPDLTEDTSSSTGTGSNGHVDVDVHHDDNHRGPVRRYCSHHWFC